MRQDEICNDILALCMKGLIYHSLLCVIYSIASEKTMQVSFAENVIIFLCLCFFMC